MFGSLSDSLQVWLGIIGVVIALAFPIVAHRATHPKRQVSYRLTAAPTVFADGSGAHPAVQARLEVWCTGRADVPTVRFDGSLPLTFRFRERVLAVTPEQGSPEAWRFARGADDHDLTLGPVPLVRGHVLATTVIVERHADMRVWSPLIDTDVVVADTAAPQVLLVNAGAERRRLGVVGLGGISAGVGAALALGAFLVAIGLTAGAVPSESPVFEIVALFVLLGLGILVGGVVTMLVAAVGRLSRRGPVSPR